MVVVARLLVACHHGLDRTGVDGSALLLLLLCALGRLAHCPSRLLVLTAGRRLQDTVLRLTDPVDFAARADGPIFRPTGSALPAPGRAPGARSGGPSIVCLVSSREGERVYRRRICIG